VVRKRAEPAESGRSILVVDDSEEYLAASRRLMERDGHEVLIAGSGAAGLEILRAREVDVILVDYLMPGMSGEEFVAALRTFRPNVHVILQSGLASDHAPRDLFRRMDIQGFHDKSDGPSKLMLWVEAGLKAAACHGGEKADERGADDERPSADHH
jgi:two-component system, cell cycle response regulator